MESSRPFTQKITTTSSNIVETFVYKAFVKASEMTINFWLKRLLFTIFSGFRKVIFQRYRPQFKWNQAVLLPQQ